jgi:hypothetical protein
MNMKGIRQTIFTAACLVGLALILAAPPATADILHLDDVIIDGSLCVGYDCVNGEGFGFDTIRLKENNLRIHFDDTSTASSYPRNDWRIMINDSANGGASYFAVEDAFSARHVFKLEAGAPPNSLYVDDGGRVGFGTATPAVELDIKDGDTPAVRLQQDGSSGFAAHSWDVAGNETNFFIRDVTDGSALPFRIRPGSPTNSIYIDQPDGDVGMGTASPQQALHINRDTTSNVSVRLENDNADWDFRVNTVGDFAITAAGSGVNEMVLEETTGDLTIIGTLTVRSGAGNQTTYPDYVFEPDYALMPLDELAAFIEREKHLPKVFSLDEIRASKGINMTELQLQILEKVEELTLYTIQQQSIIETLTKRLAELEAQPE